MTQGKRPCAPMKARDGEPGLKEFLEQCRRCGRYLEREECLEVVVRLTHWLQGAPATLVEGIRERLRPGR
jgi:hypothetical protein